MHTYIYTYIAICEYIHMGIKIHAYKQDKLKSPIQTSINLTCDYSKKTARRLLEFYWFSAA